jgi:hypothetical protein
VERLTADGLHAIEERHAEIAAAVRDGASSAEMSRLNKAFHLEIYAQSSPLLFQYAEALWKRFTPTVTIWTAEHAEALQRDHDEILAAVRAGDAPAAGRLTAEHVRHAARIRGEHPELRASGAQDREEHPDHLSRGRPRPSVPTTTPGGRGSPATGRRVGSCHQESLGRAVRTRTPRAPRRTSPARSDPTP